MLRQVFHVATSPVVAGAWAEGQELHLYGVIYDLADGHLRKLAGPISCDDGEQRRYHLVLVLHAVVFVL